MFGLHDSYPYWDDINEGIVRQFDAEPGTGMVLDVGCGRAALGQAIAEKGYQVWGIENAGEAIAVAKNRIHRLVEYDLLDHERVAQDLGANRFDYLVFSDVLEHVYDPLSVLSFYSTFLKPGGKVFISVPNGLAWLHRLEFLLGRFEYRDSGILDRTHIRFFTTSSAKRMVRETGLDFMKLDCTPFIVRAFLPLIKAVLGGGKAENADPSKLLESGLYRFYLRWFYPVEYAVARLFKGLFSFRLILVARKVA